MIKKISFSCLFFLTSILVYASKPVYMPAVDSYMYSLVESDDTIQFLKIGKDMESTKPVLLFCQGSLPIPLIVEYKDGTSSLTFVSNFDLPAMLDKYHLVMISMPHIPVSVSETSLNSQYAYVTDTTSEHSYPKLYLKNNFQENYVSRGNKVIDFISKQPWADNRNITVAGHSQGAKVALKIAATNKRVKSVGFLSGNPLGRMDQFVREVRLMAAKGGISEDAAQKKIDNLYAWWKEQYENQYAESVLGEDSPKTVISFSQPILQDMLNLKIPVYVAYGTKDMVASYCDLLPFDFVRVGKTDYKVVPYPGLNHNYCEVDSAGRSNYDKCYWEQVMGDFLKWNESIIQNNPMLH